ncbi:MAG: BCSC C-terminal domain-containing protein [Caulobacteraceae bacterium]|nr:BCSC C-terminal domain-containing protein [Caulobacteraceae bacterium]
MSLPQRLILTALCLAELAAIAASHADPWQVTIRTLGLPESNDADAPITQRSPRASSQQLFASAVAAGDISRATDIAARADDATIARNVGCIHFNAGRAASARDWFLRSVDIEHSPEAGYGAALAALALNDLDGAETALPEPPPSDAELAASIDELAARIALRRGRQRAYANDAAAARRYARAAAARAPHAAGEARLMLASADMREAQTAYADGDYGRARVLARAAAEEPQLTLAASGIEAWAALREGDRHARRMFADLYRRTPTAEYAQGLMLAYDGDVRAPALRALAMSAPGPLYDLYERRGAELAFARDDFNSAAHSDAYRERLAGSTDPWVQLTARASRRNGDPGQDQFDVTQAIWSVGGSRGRDLLQADFAFARGEAGRPATAADIGTPGLAQAFPITTSAETWAPLISWRREGALSPSVALGASPVGGAVHAAPIGAISLRQALRRGQASISLFARARGDSLLAASGLRDPATGAAWGRIIEYGGEASARRDFDNQFSISALAAISTLDGARTASNRRLRLNVGASRNWRLDGFEYFSAGPFYGFESYADNRNGYTFGNGGYFSPQQFHRLGLSLNLQTEEARRVIVRADAVIAYEVVEQDGLDVLPFSSIDPFGVGPSSRSNGLSGALSVSAAGRISERVSIVGEISAIRSAEFDSVQVGVALRYAFGDRASVTSRDLAQTPLGLTP